MNKKSILALIFLSLPSYQLLASTTAIYERDLIDANLFNGQPTGLPPEMTGSDDSVLFSQLYQSVSFQEALNLEQVPEDTFMDVRIKGIVETSAAQQLTLQFLSLSQSAEDIIVPITCDASINECTGSLEITPDIAQAAAEYDRVNIASNVDIQSNPVDAKTVTLEYQTESEYSIHINQDNNNIVATMPTDTFENKERIIITVDDKYSFETYNGTAHYSSAKINGDITEVSSTVPLDIGSVIKIEKHEGKPGFGLDKIEELETYTVSELDNQVSPDFYEIEASKDESSILVTMSKELFESKDRIMFYSHNSYLAETYDGKAYYSTPSITDNNVTIRIMTNTEIAHQLQVVFSNGTPGQNVAEVTDRRITLK
tara:strand:- start:1055 stop:2167 length:1113 start_codon:yes stop_codon:yes gene_type:complete